MTPWAATAAAELDEALADFVAGGGAPGAVAAVGSVEPSAGSSVEVVSAGIVAPECGSAPPGGGTRYDVASLTKVIATWPLVGYAVQSGRLDLEAPIGAYFFDRPDLSDRPGNPPGGLPGAVVTARQLLAHTSGLIEPTRLDRYRGSDRLLAELICAEPLDYPPGERHRYISRGYVLLGLLLPGLLGGRLDQLAEDLVWAPAGMVSTAFGPIGRGPEVAPTEQYFPDVPRVWGQPHDDSARLLGGVAGHAGVYSSVDDLAAYARWLLHPTCPLADWWATSLQPVVDAPATTAATAAPASEGGPIGRDLTRGLGWLITGDGVAYHDGFTGVSLYLAPESGRFVAVCSNAIYAGRARPGLRQLRERALGVLT